MSDTKKHQRLTENTNFSNRGVTRVVTRTIAIAMENFHRSYGKLSGVKTPSARPILAIIRPTSILGIIPTPI